MGLVGIGDVLLAVAALLFSVSGFAYLFGDSRLAKRFIVGALILAVSAPIFEASLINLAGIVGRYADVLLVAFAVVVAVLAISKYGQRTRRNNERKPTSLKNRVDD